MAASVVDLPEPVGPVTSTSPRGRIAKSVNTFGAFRSDKLGTLLGMARNATDMPLIWW